MRTYICAEGHLQYGSGASPQDYFPNCCHINCNLELIELPKMVLLPLPPSKLEELAKNGHKDEIKRPREEAQH